MTPIADILAAATPIEGGFRTTIPADWMQGRTTYGGLSAALALEVALRSEPDLPPLRSAQVAFIGPLAGEVTVTATKLRRGRNAAFIQADVSSEAGLGLRTIYVFMATLPSAIVHDTTPRAPSSPPTADAEIYRHADPTFFTSNFDFFDPKLADGPADWLRWARLRARDGLHTMVELMAIGDALAPAAFKLVADRRAPISSLDWMINFVTPEPVTEDGWWLLSSDSDSAAGGYSSQRMAIWNAAGDLIAEAMQGVAIFA